MIERGQAELKKQIYLKSLRKGFKSLVFLKNFKRDLVGILKDAKDKKDKKSEQMDNNYEKKVAKVEIEQSEESSQSSSDEENILEAYFPKKNQKTEK